MAARMIPMIWLRLIVLVAFLIFILTEGTWWIASIVVILMGVTIWQLFGAYREKRRMEDQ